MEFVENIFNLGVNDENIRLFEGQYNVPNGMRYNSYLIKDEKNVLLDTIDKEVTSEWINNLEKVLNGEKVDYLVISHMEPDHAYNIETLIEKYPEVKIVGNALTFNMIPKFFNIDLEKRKVLVKDGDKLEIGKHTLQFFMAPMVHWPEVMLTYEQKEKILFSADAFGKFGIVKEKDEWEEEARRYYFGIVGKFGFQVQAVLKKANNLDIKIICPLHGPILKENIEYYIEKYNIWSSYKAEKEGTVIACSSIYGNTLEAAKYIKDVLEEKKEEVIFLDLNNEDMPKAISKAFEYSKMIVASSSYNASLFPKMEEFLNKLKTRNYQNRTVGIIENGSWAPSAGKAMKSILQEMKDINIVDSIITIEGKMKEEDKEKLKKFCELF